MRKEEEETGRKGFFRPLDKHVNHLTLTDTQAYTYTHTYTLTAEAKSNCFSERSSLTVDTATVPPPPNLHHR